jgi:hypothetical protein
MAPLETIFPAASDRQGPHVAEIRAKIATCERLSECFPQLCANAKRDGSPMPAD